MLCYRQAVILTLVLGLIVSCTKPNGSPAVMESSSPTPTEGNEVGGGDFAVQRVTATNDRILTLLSICAATPSCVVSALDKEILSRIIVQLERHGSSKPIFLKSGDSDHPKYFGQENSHRVMASGYEPKSPIFVNLEAFKDAGGIGLSFQVLAGILAHEYGHQAGYRDHHLLSLLGNRIEQSLADQIATHPHKEFGEIAAVTVGSKPFELLLLISKEKVIDLSPHIRRITKCLSEEEPKEENDASLVGVRYSKLVWKNESAAASRLTIEVDVSRICKMVSGEVVDMEDTGNTYVISFSGARIEALFKVDVSSIDIKIIAGPPPPIPPFEE